MRWADRLPLPRRNRLSLAIDRARTAGRELIDLTVTNPTAVGLDLAEHLGQQLGALADPQVACYRPDPRGLLAARELLCAELEATRPASEPLSPGQLVLCSCSSEAYGLLLKLLCAPGDRVLVPRPSYPLLEHLVRLEAARPLFYQLRYDGRWYLDLGEIRLALASTPRPRALLVVNPNNPTGSFVSADEADALQQLCAAAGVALIADEVFFDYPRTAAARAAAISLGDRARALTFVIGGLSKSAGLPQMKLSWIALCGAEAPRREAVARLELLGDTYLSLATPVQVALRALIEAGRGIRASIGRRVATNHAELARAAAGCPACDLLSVDAGWTAVVRVPALRSEEDLTEELVQRDSVIVHPGHFFDFEQEAYLVPSLIAEPATFAEGIARALSRATSAPCPYYGSR